MKGLLGDMRVHTELSSKPIARNGDISVVSISVESTPKSIRSYTGQDNEVDLIKTSNEPSLLFKLTSEGKLEEIKSAVYAHPELLLNRDEKGASVLHHAAGNGLTRIIDFILSDKDGKQLLDSIDQAGKTALHWAVESDNAEAVNCLISNGADSSITNAREESPLHVSVRLKCMNALKALIKNKGIVDLNQGLGTNIGTAMHLCADLDNDVAAKMLMEAGARICMPCKQGYRPLHRAAQMGSTKVLQLLVEKCGMLGFTSEEVLSFSDKESCCPLHSAILGGNYESIKLCIGYGARLDKPQADMTTPMHLVCTQGAFNVVESMFELAEEQARRTLSMQDKQRHTPLHKAAMYGHADIVKFLAKHGADLDMVDADKNTPLLLAASRGNWVSVKDLLELGSNVMIQNKYNRNFFHMIVLNGGDLRKLDFTNTAQGQIQKSCKNILSCNPELHKLLNQPDLDGCTPLHYACQEGNLASLETLMILGVSARLKSAGNQSPLHFAAQYGRYNACKRLINSPQGPNIINEKDNEGMTPLHYAAENGHTKVVQLLLNKGAVFHKNLKGETVLHVASTYGYTRTIMILVEMNKTLLNITDEKDNTPLHHAGVAFQVSTVKLLLDLNAAITRNNEGHTFFTYAIQSKNREVALATVLHDRWEDAMQTFYQSEKALGVPSLFLIQHLPDVWVAAVDRCIQTPDISSKSKHYWIKYQFKYLQPSQKKKEEFLRKQREMRLVEDAQKKKSSNHKPLNRLTLPALNKMVEYDRVECLQHPVSSAYLKMKWNAYGRWFNAMSLFFYLLMIVPLTYLICTVSPTPPFHFETTSSANGTQLVQITSAQLGMIIILTIVPTAMMVKEITRMIQQKTRYLRDITNLLSWILNISTLVYVVPYYFSSPYHWQVECGAAAIFVAWFNLLLFLQRFDVAGIYVVMFIVILRTLLKVLLLFSFLIVAFALSFYILMSNEADMSFSTPALSIMRVVSMTLGEFAYVDKFLTPYVDDDTNTLHYSIAAMILLVWFIIVMPILFMNLLIGLAVGDIAQVQSNAELKRLAMQVELYTDIEHKLSPRILKLVDKHEVVVYPNRLSGILDKIYGVITSRDDIAPEGTILSLTCTDRNISYLDAEVRKQKERLKDMQVSLNKQHELLRLIVQKMEIRSEADEQDEGYHPDAQRRSRSPGNKYGFASPTSALTAVATFKSLTQK